MIKRKTRDIVSSNPPCWSSLQAGLHHTPVVNVCPASPRFRCHNKQTDRGNMAVNRRAREIISASFLSMANRNIFTPCQEIIALVSDVMLWCLLWRLMLQAKYFSAASDYQVCIKQHCSNLSTKTWQADAKNWDKDRQRSIGCIQS